MIDIETLEQIISPVAKWALEQQGNVKGENKDMPDMHVGNKVQSMKSSFSYVDATVQRLIIDEVLKLYPKMGVICEEKLEDFPNHLGLLVEGKYTLIIDPIDGTRNYLAKTPDNEFHNELKNKYNYWGVSVAIAYGNEIIAGVINYPALNIVLKTIKGNGTFINNQQIRLNKNLVFSEIDPIHTSSFAGITEPHLWGSFPDVRDLLTSASVTNFLCLLNGSSKEHVSYIDNFPKFKAFIARDVTAWDTGCIPLAYQEAGGIVVDELGEDINPFMYIKNDPKRKEIVLNTKFMLVPNQNYLVDMLKHINNSKK
ncbi:MAG: inositol monophosphatase family protein [Candidatus Woesearchaeota archaeon]